MENWVFHWCTLFSDYRKPSPGTKDSLLLAALIVSFMLPWQVIVFQLGISNKHVFIWYTLNAAANTNHEIWSPKTYQKSKPRIELYAPVDSMPLLQRSYESIQNPKNQLLNFLNVVILTMIISQSSIAVPDTKQKQW